MKFFFTKEAHQSWFVNDIFVNMELWQNVLKEYTYFFMNLDHYLMRKIVGAHSKVPIELLHLEFQNKLAAQHCQLTKKITHQKSL